MMTLTRPRHLYLTKEETRTVTGNNRIKARLRDPLEAATAKMAVALDVDVVCGTDYPHQRKFHRCVNVYMNETL